MYGVQGEVEPVHATGCFDKDDAVRSDWISELVGGVTETEILYSCSLPTTKEKAIIRPIDPVSAIDFQRSRISKKRSIKAISLD